MKKVILMAAISLFPRLLVAQELDFSALLGKDWYGLYFNGHKVGYAFNAVTQDEDGIVHVSEDAQFQLNMQGAKQDMRFVGKRTYSPDGPLLHVESIVTDMSGQSTFAGTVEGDKLLLHVAMGGEERDITLPKPRESLEDALKQARLVGQGAEVGESLSFHLFDPVYQKEIEGNSQIIGIEDRIFGGASTKIYKIKTRLDMMGIETISFVAEDGTLLEDIIAGIIKMRLEPEEMAKDTNYNNDVIVSNAALVDEPVTNPRTRKNLHLRLKGPLSEAHLFNNERQYIAAQNGAFEFRSHLVSLDELETVNVPVTDPELRKWTEPSSFVQSGNPKLIAKAKEIIDTEKDGLKVSNALTEWVYENVRTTFSARLTNALEVLDRLEGDCTEHSILFVGLARAAGLPAREVAGLVYVEGVNPGFYFHQWATVWVGKWIDVDPTFNQPQADVTHIKLAEGDLFEQAKLLPLIGQIQVEVVEDTAMAAGTAPS